MSYLKKAQSEVELVNIKMVYNKLIVYEILKLAERVLLNSQAGFKIWERLRKNMQENNDIEKEPVLTIILYQRLDKWSIQFSTELIMHNENENEETNN